jgi:hypothetical protein
MYHIYINLWGLLGRGETVRGGGTMKLTNNSRVAKCGGKLQVKGCASSSRLIVVLVLAVPLLFFPAQRAFAQSSDGAGAGVVVWASQDDLGNEDADGDGLHDRWEVDYDLDPDDPTGDNGAEGDPDADGLFNLDEYDYDCDPLGPDTDGDWLDDGEEVNTHGTDPINADSDDDGLIDGEEVGTYLTDPLNDDTDDDGYADGTEVAQGSDPSDPDSLPTPRAPGRGGGGGSLGEGFQELVNAYGESLAESLAEDSGSGSGSCFIATAAYGTPVAGEVSILCEFRDKHLLTNRAGTAFVRTYYLFSPSVARFIAAHEPMRKAVRALLFPIVAAARFTLYAHTASKALVMVIAFGLMGLAKVFLARRRQRTTA